MADEQIDDKQIGKEKRSMMGEWVKVRVLGKGSYGVVTLAVNSEDPSLPSIAVKSSRLEDSHSLESLEKEKRILDHLYGSPHILAFLTDTVSFDDQLGGWAYDLCLEYVPGGSLSDLIKKRGGHLPEREVQDYTMMILKGLCGVHEKGYVHCDLKPDNILVLPLQDGTNYLKIADFGLAKESGEEKQYGDYFRFRFRGTPLYMSPESFLFGEIEWGLDIWSLGCVVVEMLTGKHAMRWVGDVRRNLESECAFVMQQPNIPEYMSDLGKDFLTRCFARNPRERWTAEMLLNHPYLLPEMAVMSATNSMQVRQGWCSLFEDGSYRVVMLAVNSKDASLPSIAVKSSRMEDSHSLESLEKEKRILDHLYDSPHILTFLADIVSFDD
ncbi:hypothetical protein EZV62_011312 [Acer yangbiense]|uniref:Protein kinase domain-containing protein n=1 Tax=Acer yangbiense TaxID=1000413 RepID=A0A5C7I5Q3_9ROSI|nr:hypothetical protein EZV62_011312 [Acer yangbiense]